ncbi:hypothetical protein GO755_25745 [Spirosoma sp. HMF4905]|uniref:Uncharacterized protein n=1 Tax=Spirosoma arboris TaxID=2682092 RepID=A0A7K1SIS3_9BACT|nr:hypothetical protein [Spirosoma arboris]MVM33466.1 hypothetical protein [Spirosoma arboris]
MKYLLLLLVSVTLSACFPKQPGPCYNCQLVETVQVTNQTVPTSVTSYHEVCDSLEALTYSRINTRTRVISLGVVNQQEVYRIISRFTTCTRK